MVRIGYIFVALLAVPAPGGAQIVFDDNPPAATPAKSTNVKADNSVVVCKMQDELGSPVNRHKVCLTHGRWRQYTKRMTKKRCSVSRRAPAPVHRADRPLRSR